MPPLHLASRTGRVAMAMLAVTVLLNAQRPLRLHSEEPTKPTATDPPTPAPATTTETKASAEPEVLSENGSFDHADDPLKGWNVDYEWTGNSHYVANKERVTAVAEESGHTQVVKFQPAGDAGAKMECLPIVFEVGYRYRCTLDIKGGPYRIYFAGYKWQPGIRPHDDPPLGELRLIYKSKAHSGKSDSWENVSIELPGVKLSAQAKAHLKPVRYVTAYIWMMKPGFVDNIVVTRTADPEIQF